MMQIQSMMARAIAPIAAAQQARPHRHPHTVGRMTPVISCAAVRVADSALATSLIEFWQHLDLHTRAKHVIIRRLRTGPEIIGVHSPRAPAAFQSGEQAETENPPVQQISKVTQPRAWAHPGRPCIPIGLPGATAA
jgi:hypothetical protein